MLAAGDIRLREERPVKHVAVVGASGAVGERMIRLLEERSISGRLDQIPGVGEERGTDGRLPWRESSDHRTVRRRVLGRRDRAVEHAGERLSPVEPGRGRRRGGRRGQFERLPHGARRAAGRSRGQSARHPQAPGNHRQSQLLDDPDGRRAQAAARRRAGAAGRRRARISRSRAPA